MKKIINSKHITSITAGVMVVLIIILSILIYNNLFSGSHSRRLEGIEDHKLTKEEISNVKEKINELEDIKNVDIYTNEKNTKIVTIFIDLKKDVDFETLRNKLNESLTSFTEKTLSFYDVEVFVRNSQEDSDTYPKIGYKHKTSSEFAW